LKGLGMKEQDNINVFPCTGYLSTLGLRQCLSQMRLAEFKTVQIYYLASERHQEKFEDTKDVIRSCTLGLILQKT
jgi:hypothetical protein